MLLADNWQQPLGPAAGPDERWMRRAIDIARNGARGVRPNPLVGAVLARGDELLAAGWHAEYGGPHAERVVLDSIAGPIPADATLYVTLEPCAHHGRQPPCAELVIERDVRRVVIASPDPTPKTAGRGPESIRAAGAAVVWADDSLRAAAQRLNPGFLSIARRRRPYVTVKLALTADRAAATGDPDRRWVSGPDSRAEVQELRARSGAVLVGGATVRADNPQLTVRGEHRTGMHIDPVRVVLTGSPDTVEGTELAATAATVPVLVATPSSNSGLRPAPPAGVQVLPVAGDSLAERWDALMQALAGGDAGTPVNDLLVEAGPSLAERLVSAGLADRVICYVAEEPAQAGVDVPRLAAGGAIASLIDDPSSQRTSSGDDERIEAVLTDPSGW